MVTGCRDNAYPVESVCGGAVIARTVVFGDRRMVIADGNHSLDAGADCGDVAEFFDPYRGGRGNDHGSGCRSF
ncbi:hypothetical protein CULCOIPH002_22070 [Corynebacterium ulcerans]|uniref:Uncharacterized protein n=1 Tax=Corynebacterium ulcerans TaxID=65058 RepID=A0ABD0BGI9_CORUL|nr:hypothetical protein CULCOIPH001_19910 [Corynebacterium ulcerans]GJJ37295.1 hypothetical protein CULCOIPH002_22070 [Corynebacterium ulcerans]GJJ39337.1 hypothetical protein CULCOIPH003_19680 [Corynebacterium ulcerans]GJJ41737.1 hypothetical protein CULCOIPH004_21480 [Corynebacterium ulcerans]GJJ43297.1 hypothetical protein CULCOIPH005_14860 [Corynebacterium ulcerans]